MCFHIPEKKKDYYDMFFNGLVLNEKKGSFRFASNFPKLPVSGYCRCIYLNI
ncbi:unnamed protein product [Debaryomyces tyrocola]|nr:unnamed protein product [Debaryomyces tyrocola]